MTNNTAKVNTPLSAAIRTFLQVFVGLYLVRVVGFLGQLSEWAGCREAGLDACAFPDVSTLAYGLVVAGSAAVVAVIAFLQNLGEEKNIIPAIMKKNVTSRGAVPPPPPPAQDPSWDPPVERNRHQR